MSCKEVLEKVYELEKEIKKELVNFKSNIKIKEIELTQNEVQEIMLRIKNIRYGHNRIISQPIGNIKRILDKFGISNYQNLMRGN